MYLSKQLISTCIASTDIIRDRDRFFNIRVFVTVGRAVVALPSQSMMELSNEREGCWQEGDHCEL
jgi:hypothetical protein